MKKLSVLLMIVMLSVYSYIPAYANETINPETEVSENSTEEEIYQELDMEEKLRLLTETALKYDIPPEILKAIALVESEMMQFKNGKPLISYDNGVGIMQVTNTTLEVDEDRLMVDTAYNIEIGAQILKDKWDLQFSGRIPSINDANPNILENWYFAIMAYNGLSSKNDPNKNPEPYQELVYKELEKYSQIEVADFPPIQVEYNDAGLLSFPDKRLSWEHAATASTQMFVTGDQAYIMNSADPNVYNYANIRTGPNLTSPASSKQAYYTELEIVGGPYIGSSSKFNQFVMYEVKGADFTGYIASSNLRKQTTHTEFHEWDEKSSSDLKKKWTIKLNQSVNQETIHSINVFIVDEDGSGVFTELSYNESDLSITVEPETPFEQGKNYSLYIKDLISSTNDPLKENIVLPFTITQ